MKKAISLRVNGKEYDADVHPRQLLVHVLRDELNLTGTKIGCEVGKCGACTIILNGRAIKSCMMFAIQAADTDILTVEGLSKDGYTNPLQQAFQDNHALQCGYCTAGMLMSAHAFLSSHSNPSEDDIKVALAGNLCTCTGYQHILNAVKDAATKMRTGAQ